MTVKDGHNDMNHRLKRRVRFIQCYRRSPVWDTNISPPELIEFLESHPSGRALDIGCGTGTNLITMAEKGWTVEGIDFIAKAVRTARRKIEKRDLPIHVQHGDFLVSPLPAASYDLILDIGCYHSFPPEDKQIYEKKVIRSLVQGGYYLLYGFLKSDTSKQGITSQDLERLSERLKKVKDERSLGVRERPAAWLLFQRV